jgi:hypothetical protein
MIIYSFTITATLPIFMYEYFLHPHILVIFCGMVHTGDAALAFASAVDLCPRQVPIRAGYVGKSGLNTRSFSYFWELRSGLKVYNSTASLSLQPIWSQTIHGFAP